MYFSASDGSTGNELWRTDGASPVATVEQLADINPGSWGSGPNHFADLNGQLYFRADTEAQGNELWRTDGNVVQQVADMVPGEEDSNPYNLTTFKGRIYFAADDDIHGHELWVLEGGKPRMLLDILPGSDSGEPYDFTPFGNSLFFAANDGVSGSEMWRIAPDNSAAVKIPASSIRVDRAGRATVTVRCPQSEISGPCKGTVTVKTRTRVKSGGKKRKVTLGKASFEVEAGQGGKVAIRLAGPVRKLVRKSSVARKVTVFVKSADLAGNKASIRKNGLLVGPGIK